MGFPELSLLARFTSTATVAAGARTAFAPSNPTSPALPKGLLAGNEVGEVRRVVCWSPIDPIAGTSDDLQYITLVLDGQQYPYIWLSGRQDSTMIAPDGSLVRGTSIDFGQPIIDEDDQVAGLLDATCPKFITSVVPMGWAGTVTDVTHDFTVDVLGYRYDSVRLAKRMPEYNPDNVAIEDRINSRSFTAVAQPISAAGDWRGAWLQLPGGPAQGAMPINKLIRVAVQQNATQANTGYVPQYANSSTSPAVQFSQDNLYFKLNARQALLVERYGVNGPAYPNSTGDDIQSAWIQTGDEGKQQHPMGGIPADYNRGRTRWGLLPGEINKFAGVPKLPQGPQLLTNEIAYPTFVDNGTSLPAKSVRMCMVATLMGSTAEGL